MKHPKKRTSIGMATLLASSSILVAPIATPALAEETGGPKILITELVRNSQNETNPATGKAFNAYEFIELYNNSADPIDLKDYMLLYGYPDTTKAPVDWSIKDSFIIQPGETKVVWIQSEENEMGLTITDFNNIYNTNFSTEDVAVIKTNGIDNSKSRSFTLTDANGTVITEIHTDEVGATTVKGESLNYAAAGTATRLPLLANQVVPTPGTLSVEQLINNLPATSPPVTPSTPNTTIVHTAIPEASTKEPFKVTATLSELEENAKMTLFYRPIAQAGAWMSFTMENRAGSDFFEGTIPNSLFKTANFEYKLEATVNGNIISSPSYTTSVKEIAVNYQKVPELLLTELLPNSINYKTADGTEVEGYEFIEVYNNSNAPIDLNDYTIQYQGETLVPDAHNVVLQPGEAAVYWLMNEGNRSLTLADFNKQYGTNLTENQVIRMNGFMTNTSKRTLSIISNTGEIISTASYYDQKSGFGIIDTDTGTNVLYAYPQDGSTTMVKYDYLHGTGTPGFVESIQVPAELVDKGSDSESPVYEDVTKITLAPKNEPLKIQYAITDNNGIKTARLYYRFKGEGNYQSVNLLSDQSGVFAYEFAAVNLLNKENIEYYAQISDGVNTVTTNPTTIAIEPVTLKTNGFNLIEGSSVAGNVAVEMYNTNGTLKINDIDLSKNTTQSLADDAYFVFEGAAIDNFFQNGVTVNKEVLSVYNVKIADFKVLPTRIPSSMVKKGETFKVDLRAGTKIGTIDEGSTENRDDFKMKNPKLVLGDGTVIYDSRFTEKDVVYNVGDSSATALPVYTFEFDIPEKNFSAIKYEWDTSTLADGNYTISDGTETIQVYVDNTAPVIEPSVTVNETYKGPFTVDAKFDDPSGIKEVTAILDGKEITLPYATGSANLEAGEHTLSITAMDAVGNSQTKTVTFMTEQEHPSVKGQKTNVKGTSATLSIDVSDPQADPMNVTFYKGYKYTPGKNDTAIQVYEDSSLTEPPTSLPVIKDTLLTADDEHAIEAVDDDYLSVFSTSKYPYHRFEVQVDEAVKETDLVKINWTGKSLKDRKVSMYLWNYTTAQWDVQVAHIAQNEEDFDLTASLPASQNYVQNGKIQVVVQDEIAASADYDYSFIWMSDTQYYSESYPEIFDSMTKWIADKRDELGIQYVFHTGDLVDEADKEYQWEHADQYMKTLEDANIPYGVLAGNHDVSHTLVDYTKYEQYFGAQRFEQKTYYKESYNNNRGHYDVLNINGTEYVMLYMGWGIGDNEIAWMNDVLAQYPDAVAFLNFHEYLTADGVRSTIADKVYKEVVIPNANVKVVLSGHIHDAETLIDEIDDNGDGVTDRKVYQMLANYQGAPQGGLGYLRILKVNQANGTIAIETYSPYLDDYEYYNSDEYPGKDTLTMPMDFTQSAQEKRVDTNAFSVEVFTNKEIGTVPNPANDSTVTYQWNNLLPNTQYGWYAKVSDEFGGEKNTDVALFSTTENGTQPPTVEKPDSGDNNNSNTGSSNSNSSSNESIQPPTTPNDLVLNPTGHTTIPLEDSGLTLTSAFVEHALKEGQTLQFNAPNGVQAILSPANLQQLQNLNTDIVISIADTQAEIPNSTLYSPTITVNITANNQPLSLQQIEVRLPVTNANATQYMTSIRYNPLTKAWEYNGGNLNGENWVTTASANSIITVASRYLNFPDINNHWAEAAIKELASKFIINGKDNGLFEPSATLTRAQFTIMLARIFQLPTNDYEGIFTDVSNISGADALQIEAAYRAGITTGKGDQQFDPTSSVTRQQMTVMMIRALENASPEVIEQLAKTSSFKDESSISDYARNSVSQAAALGLINGREDGTFSPKENATRAQATTIIQRLLHLLKK